MRFKRKLRKAKRIMNHLVESSLGFLDSRTAKGNTYQFAKALLKDIDPYVTMTISEYFRRRPNKVSRLQRISDQGLLVAFI